ncbi:MAG: endonuclease/exonuclease/phosphatase family protein, partial [Planctomycetota bacterium]
MTQRSLLALTAVSAVLATTGMAQSTTISTVEHTVETVATASGPTIRVASFNAFLNRFNEGDLTAELATPDSPQVQAVAEIIQRVRPDVILLNEVDFDASEQAINLLRRNYLSQSQNGAQPISYRHAFVAPSNTGLPSGFDLNNDGVVGTEVGTFDYANDALGFGFFPGQFGMAVLSRFPLDEDNIRTFQNFLWADMPGALLPDDDSTPEPADFYSAEELAVFPLSSKSHWDIPVLIGGETLHLLAAHPTPPVFDGPEDRNGRRNFDEIRFWADYVTPGAGDYIYDDEGSFGGLGDGERFAIVGDYNSDPLDGDSIPGAIQQLTDSDLIVDPCPTSLGGLEKALMQGLANALHISSPAFDTADFGDEAPGNLRADYVLSSANNGIAGAGVFWPGDEDPLSALTGDGVDVVSSDHRLVWADLAMDLVDDSLEVPEQLAVEFLGEATFPTGLIVGDTELGGLSAIVYEASIDTYIALSDDRGALADSRAYTLSIDLSNGTLGDGDVVFGDVITLLDE